jgi:phytoene desaturase
MTAHTGIIGAGFAGLAAANVLASAGHDVHVFEKHSTPGGRARQWVSQGFTFDMGPSWYWMPDVFDRFFQRFGRRTEELYDLRRLDPAFTIFFGQEDVMHVPAEYDALREMFEEREKGTAAELDRFMREAELKYKVGVQELVYMPGESITEFFTWPVMRNALRLDLMGSLRKHVRRRFKDDGLRALMEFPVLFLGASPAQTPALYSMMNYAGLKLGTWYPMGGFGSVVRAMHDLAHEQGVEFSFDCPVTELKIHNQEVREIVAQGASHEVDAVVAAADYHHVEQQLLPAAHRRYTEHYWERRTMAPSCILFYLGLNRKVAHLSHHNLFFDADLDAHTNEIYTHPQWPSDPLFYACCPSKTDPSVAPEGHENLFLLIPVAPGLADNRQIVQRYFDIVMDRLEKHTGERIRDAICLRRDYSVADFKSDYNAFRGNAYGLANTLRQTALLKPRIRGKRIDNLVFAGHLTVPGPGVPPALISGQVAAQLIIDKMPVEA